MTQLNYNQLLKQVSSKNQIWSFGAKKDKQGIHYYLSKKANLKDIPTPVIELAPDPLNKTKHIVKLIKDNWPLSNMAGLEAGQLAAILQLAAIIIMNIDYGITPKNLPVK